MLPVGSAYKATYLLHASNGEQQLSCLREYLHDTTVGVDAGYSYW